MVHRLKVHSPCGGPPMLQPSKGFVTLVRDSVPLEGPIYEFGAFQVPGQDGDLRGLFPGHKYVGSDFRPGPGVDVILDLHHLDLPDESVATAICLDTLEHVEYPERAVS